jgi:ABC-type transport system involved in Fe-S cluster assembly fused permease/ATPase subunit
VKNPLLLMLDEATSALDTITEKKIQVHQIRVRFVLLHVVVIAVGFVCSLCCWCWLI